MSENAWLNEFADPPVEFRPVPFWSWNEDMQPAEVRRQVQLIAEAGWGGAFIHSRIGLTTPYLGEAWFDAVDATLEQCRTQGLKVWLYDEDKWPSGTNGGTVPLADITYRMKVLIARSIDATPPKGATPLGEPVDHKQVYAWTAPLGHAWFNGTCYTDLMNRQAMGRFLDDAYEPYHQRYAGEFGQLITAAFTDEPGTIFRARLPQGAVPYSEILLDRFRLMHGYDPQAKLHLLFRDGPGAGAFRLHYFRTVNDLFETNFSKQLGDWCRERAIDFTGHYMAEDSLFEQQNRGVKIMPNYRHQAIPGIDHLGRQVEHRLPAIQCRSVVNQYGKRRMLSELYGVAGQNLSFEDRLWIASQQIALGVNVLNPHLSLYTMAGCRKRDFPANLFYQQPWWPLNRFVDDPLSRLCVALSRGRYLGEALVIHPQESTFVLWESHTRAEADHVFLDNPTGAWEVVPPITPQAVDQIEALDKHLKSVMDVMLGAQRCFDLGDETILAQAGRVVSVNDQALLQVGQMQYPVVILPSMVTIAHKTLDLLEDFQQRGGMVLRCGRAPDLIDGRPDSHLTDWLTTVPQITLDDLPLELACHSSPAVQLVEENGCDTSLVFVHVRDLEDGDRLVYLTNLDRCKTFEVAVQCSGQWASVYRLDPFEGSEKLLRAKHDSDHVQVDLSFAPTQGHLLRLSNTLESTAPEKPETLSLGNSSATIDLTTQAWTIERLDDNAITLDYASWCEGDTNESLRPLPVIAIQQRLNALKYDGPLTLRYPLNVHALADTRKTHLVVEYPQRYRIRVNGHAVHDTGLDYWRDIRWQPIDITGLLQEGQNIIELHCDDFQHGDLSNTNDPVARYGTEIEAVYIVGDFAVWGKPTDQKPLADFWSQWNLPPVNVPCFAYDSFYLSDPKPLHPGDTTLQGLPFYAGRLRLTTNLPQCGERCREMVLQIGQLDAAVAEVSVDDHTVGHFVSQPWQVGLPESVGSSDQRLAITLYGTLRNLLGPHHSIEGESPAVGPHNFLPVFKNPKDIANATLQWAQGELEPQEWKDDYSMVGFGDLGSVSLITRSQKSS